MSAILILCEIPIESILEHFYFLRFFLGKSFYMIFCGLLCFSKSEVYTIIIGILLFCAGIFYLIIGLCFMSEESNKSQNGTIKEVKVINPHEKANVNININIPPQ